MKRRIRLFKSVDPLVQSLLFILFIYTIYSDYLPYRFPYEVAFRMLLVWQLISAVAHLSFKRITKLKQQRKYHLIVVSIYLFLYIVFTLFVPEIYLEDNLTEGKVRVPLFSISLLGIGLAICFWYSIICFREIKRILEKAQHLDS